jgi:hypothetical protein
MRGRKAAALPAQNWVVGPAADEPGTIKYESSMY